MSPLKTPVAAPPLWAFRAVMALRNRLLALTDGIVPGPIAMIDRLSGYYKLHMIHAAAQLGIADALANGPKNVDSLAAAVKASPDSLNRLMRALVSFGVFTQDAQARYSNNRRSKALLTGADGSLRDLALFVGSPYHLRAWDKFVDSVRTGAPAFDSTYGKGLFDYYRDHSTEAAHFNGAMVGLTEIDAPALAAAYDFGALGTGKVCDVAGGRGTLLATILARYARLRGLLFDEQRVVDSAADLLKAYGVADRVETVGGSFFEKIPSGCDAYLMKDILHDWDDARALHILKVVRAAMSEHARLLIAEMIVDGPAPQHFGALLDLEMLAIMGGRQRSLEQFRTLFAKAGLRLTRVVPAASPTSFVEAMPA